MDSPSLSPCLTVSLHRRPPVSFSPVFSQINSTHKEHELKYSFLFYPSDYAIPILLALELFNLYCICRLQQGSSFFSVKQLTRIFEK